MFYLQNQLKSKNWPIGIVAVIENKWCLMVSISWDFWINVTLLGLFITVVSFFLYFHVINKIGFTCTHKPDNMNDGDV